MKNLLNWQNVTHPETLTLREMSGPPIVVKQLMGPSGKKCLETPGV